MNIALEECVPCLLNQMIAASQLATDDHSIRDEIIEEFLQLMLSIKDHQHCLKLFQKTQEIITHHTGVEDPYKDVKKVHIDAVLNYYPHLLSLFENKEDKLFWALKAAAAGNSIDLVMFSEVNIDAVIEKELEIPFIREDYKEFQEKLETAKDILIIADNAGESVFDRILIDNLPDLPITYAVRGKPIINDVIIEDAIASKINARIISSGSFVPGTIISEVTEEFKTLYHQADLVISKGQGNYVSLSKEREREIFFLFKAKCAVVTKFLKATAGDYFFISNFSNK